MWTVDIEKIAGIRSGTAHLHSGLNVVQASNFSGKSSFMHALRTVLGTTGEFGETHPLQDGADEGCVSLETDDETYEVTLNREGRNLVSQSGTPVLSQSESTQRRAARLFAMLGEDNPLRQAVRTYHEGDDSDPNVRNEGERLTELLQEPIDVNQIKEKISELEQERAELEQEKQEAKRAADKLPKKEERRQSLKSELEDLREERDELKEEMVEQSTSDDSTSQELKEANDDLEQIKRNITITKSRIEDIEDELADRQAELDDLEIPDKPELTRGIEDAEGEIEELELDIDLLQDLIRVNQQVLDESAFELVSEVDHQLSGDQFDCWVCGDETSEADVEQRLEALRSVVDEKQEQKEELEEKVDRYRQQESERQSKLEEKNRLEKRISQKKSELTDKRGQLEDLQDNKKEQKQRVEELEEEVEDEEEEQVKGISSVESDISEKEGELEDVTDEIGRLEKKADREEQLAGQIEDLKGELEELRAKKSRQQRELAEAFNEEIEAVIDKFAPGFGSARLDVHVDGETGDVTGFKMSIARDGRETSIDSLSEGETELIGIVLAIAGYRTFEVDEYMPVILIDGISELAAEHLHNLTEYLEDTSEVLVTTAYPEAGDFNGEIVTPTDWEVVSDAEQAPA